MNVLTNKLPLSVVIGGVEYAMNANFRTSILFSEIMNKDIEEEEKIFEILELYYPILPESEFLNEAIEKIMWFFRCGKEIKESKKSKSVNVNEILSYEHDSDYIYSAFLEQYKIDLQLEDNLHWWKFKALFDGLRDETQIKKIMMYRSIDLKEIKEDSQKEFYKEMKELYKLPSVEDTRDKKVIDATLDRLMKYQ